MKAFIALIALSLAVAACGGPHTHTSLFPPCDGCTEGGSGGATSVGSGDGTDGHDGGGHGHNQ